MAPTSFLSLPYELREGIWLQSLYSRTIHVHFKQKRVQKSIIGPLRRGQQRTSYDAIRNCLAFSEYEGGHHRSGKGWSSPNTSEPLRPPAILHVCVESRDIGLRFYQLSFGNRVFDDEQPIDFAWNLEHSPEKPIWINFNLDDFVLCLGVRAGFTYIANEFQQLLRMAPDETKKIERLALCASRMPDWPGYVHKAVRRWQYCGEPPDEYMAFREIFPSIQSLCVLNAAAPVRDVPGACIDKASLITKLRYQPSCHSLRGIGKELDMEKVSFILAQDGFEMTWDSSEYGVNGFHNGYHPPSPSKDLLRPLYRA